MDTNNQRSTGIKPIEIFKPGSFIAMNGKRYTFTPQHVQELADTYNPAFADAPLVVGHPQLTSPRFGRAGRLFINDAGVLCAEADEVVPEFAEAVNAKLYPRVSASIYLPDAPGNPAPGKHYLRHIGFLGGAAPAVKGLKAVEFAADQDGIVDFSYERRTIVRIFRGLRDWFVAKEGMEVAQELIPDYQLESLEEDNIREEISGGRALPAFSNPHPQQTETIVDANKQALDAQAATLAKKEKELRELETQLTARAAAQKKTDHAEFAEALCTSGQLLPAAKDTVVAILTQLDGANQVADFAEGHENHGKTGADLFKAFLSSQPKQVVYGRVAPTGGAVATAGAADFAAPPGYDVDPAGLELVQKANAYIKEHPGTDFIDAVKAVQV
jgi:hypothetical protein